VNGSDALIIEISVEWTLLYTLFSVQL